MNFTEAVGRLRNHSNLLRPEEEFYEDRASFVYLLFELEQNKFESGKNHFESGLAACLDNILECLEVANRELNGAKPSEKDRAGSLVPIDYMVAYAVSGIVFGGLSTYRKWQAIGGPSAEAGALLLRAVWTVAGAWDDVLAGDIDSLRENAELESRFGFPDE
jgi:hypothetical protein